LDTGWRSLPEIILETSIDGRWRVELESGELTVKPGDVFAIPAGVRHRLVALEVGGMHSTWMHLHWEVADLPLSMVGAVAVLPPPAAAKLEALCLAADAGEELEDRIRFQRIGLEVLELMMGRFEVRAIVDPRIGRAVEFARANFGRAVSRADLARAAGLSETRFHDLFFAATGEAPVQFVNRLRLRQAITLLLHSEQPVGEIASACGFASDFYFSRFFKQKMGVSPRQFRQSAGGAEV
jgi:AraC-like DNA-binding protein